VEQRLDDRVQSASPKHGLLVQAPRAGVTALALDEAGGRWNARPMEAIVAIAIFILAFLALNRYEFGRFD
jgi:ribose/xylose/arabinose/galactoside ABC-type transport system permease subunit